MGVPTSEVGYTAAMSRREDHEVHKDMWWHWTKKEIIVGLKLVLSPGTMVTTLPQHKNVLE